jgi:hypothetical protein
LYFLVIIYGMFNGTIFRPTTQEVAGGEACKGKVVPMSNYAPLYEDVGGNFGVAPLILNLGARWR